ncbi:hypothetical protein KIH74_07740 [Kineosporia sp. J2-2]|uniref:Uncharacterized protein n=1 Tax=Kineosporia corallincola TaxID=2835133 RepID=A0ABS5TCK9_9ACTN|nr:hypothetical protein [Kineosporia corallincola]MBT0768813.1 hypothetical protein [Kineosporia corallincola]
MWRTVAGRMAGHHDAGRTHLLGEDVLRFETVLALGEAGVPARRLRAGVTLPALAGGRVGLVVDPESEPATGLTVVALAFPHPGPAGVRPDAAVLGELLRDLFRLAQVRAEQRWVVQLLDDRLADALRTALDSALHSAQGAAHDRPGPGRIGEPGARLELDPAGMATLQGPAGRALGNLALGHRLTAHCRVAEPAGPGRVLFAYLVEPLAGAPVPAVRADVPSPSVPLHPADPVTTGELPVLDSGTRDGARREILDAVRSLARGRAEAGFTVDEVVAEMRRRGTGCAESTIRTMVADRLRAGPPGRETTALTLVGPGLYRLTR